MSTRTDHDGFPILDAGDYHRAVEMSQMRRLMRYGPEEFKEDWETAVALAQLMTVHDSLPGQRDQLEYCFNRMLVYLSIHPDARPWEQKRRGLGLVTRAIPW